MKKISRDTPLAEITLRKYEKPQTIEDREIVRKICLSLGLLQPGDSRDVIVDVFHVILINKNKELTATEIEKLTIENREKHSALMLGITPSNVRRQILRLRDMFLVEKVANNYRINENSKLIEIFSEKIEQYYLNSIVERTKEYLKEADRRFKDV
jgi:DNA-binding transcriptional ArsR family regulator